MGCEEKRPELGISDVVGVTEFPIVLFPNGGVIAELELSGLENELEMLALAVVVTFITDVKVTTVTDSEGEDHESVIVVVAGVLVLEKAVVETGHEFPLVVPFLVAGGV